MKKYVRVIFFSIIILLVMPIPVFSMEFDVNAKSAILIDANSGEVIYEKNSHEKLPMASVTKIMTMLLAMEAIESRHIALTDIITISPRSASMGGSQLYMEEGEQQSLETLMKGISICSANDACVAVGEHIAGTEEVFVKKMNEKAEALGMINTNFVNTNGLPAEGHYSSAYDISIMSRELLKYPKIHEWLTTWMASIKVGLQTKEQTDLEITNTNRLIKTYPGANGIKTGYTGEAGYCLSASATKGNMTLISVVLGSPTSKIRFDESSKLLDYGFAAYESINIAGENQIMGKIKVDKGNLESVNGISGNNISILVKKEEKQSISKEIHIEENISAPLKKGDIVGEIIIFKNDEIYKTYPIICEKDVERAGIFTLYFKLFRNII